MAFIIFENEFDIISNIYNQVINITNQVESDGSIDNINYGIGIIENANNAICRFDKTAQELNIVDSTSIYMGCDIICKTRFAIKLLIIAISIAMINQIAYKSTITQLCAKAAADIAEETRQYTDINNAQNAARYAKNTAKKLIVLIKDFKNYATTDFQNNIIIDAYKIAYNTKKIARFAFRTGRYLL